MEKAQLSSRARKNPEEMETWEGQNAGLDYVGLGTPGSMVCGLGWATERGRGKGRRGQRTTGQRKLGAWVPMRRWPKQGSKLNILSSGAGVMAVDSGVAQLNARLAQWSGREGL